MINSIDDLIIDTKDQYFKQMIIQEAVKILDDPFKNLTVKDVAEDLMVGIPFANKIFKRRDFPSVNIGKQKTVTQLAYILWKMEQRDDIGRRRK